VIKSLRPSFFVVLFSAGLPSALLADSGQAFPPAHDLFAPLQADPTEAHFAVEAGLPVSQRAIARADVTSFSAW